MPAYGIDTSVFVRLLTGLPEADYEKTLKKLVALRESQPAPLLVAGIVIAEAYAVVQHHYRIDKETARTALVSVLTSGLVAPTAGDAVLRALEAVAAGKEPGLTDRLIALDYAAGENVILTLDKKMSRLPGCRLL